MDVREESKQVKISGPLLIALHLAPGLIFGGVFFILARMFIDFGLTGYLALLVIIPVCLAPIEIGVMLFWSARETGRRSVAEVQLTGRQGKHNRMKAELKECEQRISVQSGSRDIGGSVALSRITGRITGCGTRGHWWVRAAPICKGDASVQPQEGYVRPAGGTFAIAGSFSGARHTVSIGNGRDPVNVVAVDVVEGARTDWARLTSAAFVESDLHGIAAQALVRAGDRLAEVGDWPGRASPRPQSGPELPRILAGARE